MTAQSPPFALQNASHSAALFRQAVFSSWLEQSGIVGAGDFAVTAQSTPNMSVLVAAGRAWMKGTQVASVSGGTWSPQAGYFGINDAPVTLTIAAADPTNPRIDLVVAYTQDAFYSGSTNALTLGVVTGTPAPSPAAPAAPNNALTLATVAVAANATSIASGNITSAPGRARPRGVIAPVRYVDVNAGATWTAPGGGTLTSTRTIDPAALFGPGFGAIVLVDGTCLIDTVAGAAAYWYYNLNTGPGGLLRQDAGNISQRTVLHFTFTDTIAAGSTGTYNTTLTSPGTPNTAQVKTYADATSNSCHFIVIPVYP